MSDFIRRPKKKGRVTIPPRRIPPPIMPNTAVVGVEASDANNDAEAGKSWTLGTERLVSDMAYRLWVPKVAA